MAEPDLFIVRESHVVLSGPDDEVRLGVPRDVRLNSFRLLTLREDGLVTPLKEDIILKGVGNFDVRATKVCRPSSGVVPVDYLYFIVGLSTHTGIQILRNDGVIINNLVAGKTDLGQFYVDYSNSHVYFCTEIAGEVHVRRVNFDGTGEVDIVNTGQTGGNYANVFYDPIVEKLIITAFSRIFLCDIDGGNLETINSINANWDSVGAGIDGVLFPVVRNSGVALNLRTFEFGSSEYSTSGNITNGVVSSLVNKVFFHRHFVSTGSIRSADLDLTNVEVLIQTDVGSWNPIYLLNDYVYFLKSDDNVYRFHVSDPIGTEEVWSSDEFPFILTSGAFFAPFPVVEQPAFRFFRLTITATAAGGQNFSGIRELEIRTSVGGVNALLGLSKTVTSSGEESGADDNAFDGSYAEGSAFGWIVPWSDDPEWVQCELAAEDAIVAAEYAIGGYTTGTNTANRSPGAFTLEGSNDGSNWIVLNTQSGITWTGHNFTTPKVFTL